MNPLVTAAVLFAAIAVLPSMLLKAVFSVAALTLFVAACAKLFGKH